MRPSRDRQITVQVLIWLTVAAVLLFLEAVRLSSEVERTWALLTESGRSGASVRSG